MRNLQKAMTEEKTYIKCRLNNISSNFSERLLMCGYQNIEEYFEDKRQYMFSQWNPKVYYIDEDFLDTQMEKNIQNGVDGIYIIEPKNEYYAFHGNDEIDYDECRKLNVRPIEMHYSGGTIIGNKEDLGILLVIPKDMMISHSVIMRRVMEIIKKDCPTATSVGNDVLVGDEKVMGSMTRYIGNYFIWAAQFSFANHDDLISKICKKDSRKKPSKFKLLTKNTMEKEMVKWLKSQEL